MKRMTGVSNNPCAIIDFPSPDGARNSLEFDSPKIILCAETHDQVRSVLRHADMHARTGSWVVGFVSYDAAPAFDGALRVRGVPPYPLAWFGVFDAPFSSQTESVSTDKATFGAWQASLSRERFYEDIAAIRLAIRDGDVYQVNHTLRLHGSYTGNDLALFRRLQHAQPDSYSAYFNLGQWRILSVSPELFFRRDGDTLTAKPMKGTAGRGRYPEEDRESAAGLKASEKNRAENLMIVDLLRNDLSKIAMPNSVLVQELFSIERHPTLLQMTSTITAQARPGTALDDIFGALFPCGSVTGAPKVKAMEIIARSETEPRGIYCGAIGLLRPGGDATFNVAIRTVTMNVTDSTAICGIGSGIVWDSSAPDEYEEVVLKSRFLDEEPDDFHLLETMRLESGRYARLDFHLARLSSSAEYFGWSFDLSLCRERLSAIATQARFPIARVRISLDAKGDMDICVSPAPQPIIQPAMFDIYDTPVSPNSIWLFHKTTRRDVFEHAMAAHPDVFDVLLLNEQGELTEFTRGNLVVQKNGRNLTPSIDCGLLNGCLRRELLEEGKITEARLTLEDLECAERIWFINSLRGWVEMVRRRSDESPLPIPPHSRA
jgi:para-aminobenzoate synthetase / 4-amino-4-deoxychorismate lyase